LYRLKKPKKCKDKRVIKSQKTIWDLYSSRLSLRFFSAHVLKWYVFVRNVRKKLKTQTKNYHLPVHTLLQMKQCGQINQPHVFRIFQTPHLGDIGRPCKGLTSTQLSLLQRYDPSSDTSQSKYFTDNDTIGFFIAKFVKKTEWARH